MCNSKCKCIVSITTNKLSVLLGTVDSTTEMQLAAGAKPAALSSHAQRVLSSLNQQRVLGRFCDAALNMGDGLVYLAHRSILACFSDLFQQAEASPAPCTELHLEECPDTGLQLLLNFIYTGELQLSRENLAQVQHAAASLCVPDVLLLCQRFRETAVEPQPLKRKRGRPRKTAPDATLPCSFKEEVVKDDSGFNPAPSASAAPPTTTRSGRTVKGPKRLVTDEDEALSSGATAGEGNFTKALTAPTEGGAGSEAGNQSTGQPAGESQTNELKDNGVGLQRATEVEDCEEAGGLDGAAEGSDEDYVPSNEAPPAAPSTSAARRRRAHAKAAKGQNGQVLENTKKKKKQKEASESVLCPICDKSFKSKYYLKVHNRRHTGERPFACSKCGKRYFRKENLLIHEIRDCARLQSYSCGMCPATFSGKEQLRLHVVSHTGDMPHKCSLCAEQFMLKKYMSMHMMKVHGFPKPHACPQCSKTFLTRTELRVHEAAKHRGEKPFVCEECGHRASSRNGLQMHIKAIHRNERPFVCSLCGHAFSQKNNLNMHLRIHSGEKPFQCHLCGKTFRTQASLDKHNRTHTGERPFGCDVCEQRFTEKGALLRHKASKHEEGRPHSCHICGKTFKAREQLRVHLRRHKGMRKFECCDCGYKFTRQAHLRRHVQIHKRNENYNPRQRKLRNVVVQDVGGNPDQNQDTKTPEASLSDSEPADFNPETCNVQEAANQETDSLPVETGMESDCIMRVVIGPGDTVLEEVVSDQNLGPVEAEESFPVTEVLQAEQLVTEVYQSTVHMDAIAEEMSHSKS